MHKRCRISMARLPTIYWLTDQKSFSECWEFIMILQWWQVLCDLAVFTQPATEDRQALRQWPWQVKNSHFHPGGAVVQQLFRDEEERNCVKKTIHIPDTQAYGKKKATLTKKKKKGIKTKNSCLRSTTTHFLISVIQKYCIVWSLSGKHNKM